jgi:NAD+ kinase
VDVSVDDFLVTAFRGDGLLVSTATGSTAYNLASGGPLLPPTAPYLIVKPLSPHPVSEAPLLVDPASLIHVRIRTDHGATLTVDGQVDENVGDGDEITVRRSPYQARFLRLRPPGYFYGMLRELLSGARRHPDLPDDPVVATDDDASTLASREARR